MRPRPATHWVSDQACLIPLIGVRETTLLEHSLVAMMTLDHLENAGDSKVRAMMQKYKSPQIKINGKSANIFNFLNELKLERRRQAQIHASGLKRSAYAAACRVTAPPARL